MPILKLESKPGRFGGKREQINNNKQQRMIVLAEKRVINMNVSP